MITVVRNQLSTGASFATTDRDSGSHPQTKWLAVKIFAFIVLVGWATVGVLAADVEVRLSSGRVISGTLLEAKTDRERLTLELRTSTGAVKRTLVWDEVSEVRVIPAIRLRSLKTTAHQDEANPPAVSPAAELPLSQLFARVEPSNSQGRLDFDSLWLSLLGLDELGTSVPLTGTLRVTLWGLREADQSQPQVFSYVNGVGVSARRRQLEKIQTWTRSVDSTIQRLPGIAVPVGARQVGRGALYEDLNSRSFNVSGFGGQSVSGFEGRQDRGRLVYERESPEFVQMILPLPRPLPDSDETYWPFGEVSVELMMPGVGVFSAASPGVVLVHQSPLRQELLNQNGSRFFPDERTTDSRVFWNETRQPLQLKLVAPPFPVPATP